MLTIAGEIVSRVDYALACGSRVTVIRLSPEAGLALDDELVAYYDPGRTKTYFMGIPLIRDECVIGVELDVSSTKGFAAGVP